MKLKQVLLFWISGILSILHGGQADNCLPDPHNTCAGWSLSPSGLCVAIPKDKKRYSAAEQMCVDQGGYLLKKVEVNELMTMCLSDIHPQPKTKFIWLVGNKQCTLFNIKNGEHRYPGCKKGRYFACVKEPLQVTTTTTTTTTTELPTTESQTSPDASTEQTMTSTEMATTTIEMAATMEPWRTSESDDEDSTEYWGDVDMSSRASEMPTTEDPFFGHRWWDSSTAASLQEETSTTGSSSSEMGDSTMEPSTMGDSTMEDDEMGDITIGDNTMEDDTMVDSTTKVSATEEGDEMEEGTTQAPAPVTCPKDFEGPVETLCYSVSQEMMALEEAEKECMNRGASLMSKDQLSESLKALLLNSSEFETGEHILRLTERDCVSLNKQTHFREQVEVVSCVEDVKSRYICVIDDAKTGGSKMGTAAPVAGATLAVTSFAILVSLLVP